MIVAASDPGRRALISADRATLELLLHRHADGVIVVARDGTIRYANPAAAALLSRDLGDLVGHSFGIPVAGVDRTEVRVRHSGVTCELTVAETVWGLEDAYLVALHDVSQQQRERDAARAAQREAETAAEARKEFLLRASHELRTPLTPIYGYSELLLDMGELSPVQERWVRVINRCSRIMSELVNDILDLSRLEGGTLKLKSTPVAVVDVFRQASDILTALAGERRVHLDYRAPGGLEVAADATRLVQILLNLGSNAIKYNRHGGRVTLDAAPDGDERVAISVTDDGPGIPEHARDRIFVPFDRLGAERTSVPGVGLGLALSRAMAQEMGGELGCTSEVGRGSTFTLTLPRA